MGSCSLWPSARSEWHRHYVHYLSSMPLMSHRACGMWFLVVLVMGSSCSREGCTEPHADNFNPRAKEEDGTCSYEEGAYGYAEQAIFQIQCGVAEIWGPVTQADITVYHENVPLDARTIGGGWSIHTFDCELFLSADVRNGEIIRIEASSAAMTGSASGPINSSGFLDLGFIMIQ